MVTVTVFELIFLLVLVFLLGGFLGAMITLHYWEKEMDEVFESFDRVAAIANRFLDQNLMLSDWIKNIPNPCTEEAMAEHMKKLNIKLHAINEEMEKEEDNDDQD